MKSNTTSSTTNSTTSSNDVSLAIASTASNLPTTEESSSTGTTTTITCCNNQRLIVILASTFGCLACLVILLFICAVIISHISIKYADYVTPVPSIDPMVAVNYNGGEVIIVGAGTSGLFAAYTLQYLGIPFTILEASDRFGGRVQRMEDFVDVPLDLGAEWIHTNPVILQDLLLHTKDQEAAKNIETIGFQPQSYSFWKNGRRQQFDWARFFYKEYKFKNTTWSQYLENYVVPYVEDHIIYNAVVDQVDYSEKNQVTVTTEDGTTYKGEKVIMAVPVSVLQDEDVVFTPALPKDKSIAIEECWWGSGLKVFIEFKEKFYTDMTLDVSFTTFLEDNADGDRIFFNGVFGKDQTTRNVLSLFSAGEPAREWTSLSDDDLLFEQVMAKLDEIYDGQASKNYLKHRIQNWDKNPYIRGAYVLDGDTPTIELPVGNNLFFATDTESTVHSAALSGRRAAVEVVSA